MLAFGLAFLLPVLMVGLNLAHVVPGPLAAQGLAPGLPVAFLFAAVADAVGDPWSMIIMAIPMVALFFVRGRHRCCVDRRRARATAPYAGLTTTRPAAVRHRAVDGPAPPTTTTSPDRPADGLLTGTVVA